MGFAVCTYSVFGSHSVTTFLKFWHVGTAQVGLGDRRGRASWCSGVCCRRQFFLQFLFVSVTSKKIEECSARALPVPRQACG